jgi:hypothetical protein
MKTQAPFIYSLLAILSVFPPNIGAAEDSKWSRSDFEREALLMEITEGDFGPGSIDMLEGQEKRKLTADEKAVFGGTDDGRWKTFEDDFVRFDLPDHPLLKVDVVTPEKRNRIRVVGDAVGTTNNRFQRAYRMTVNDLPFGVLLLSEAEWFDDGICLCGPIVHKTCILKEGTLIEFSLLPEGRVKKVQALGAKHRAVLFEWTHSVLTAERYQRIGASIRLKQRSNRSIDDWMAIERKHRDESDRLGLAWLRRDDAEARVRSLVGTPTRNENGTWVFEKEDWDEDGSGRLVSLSLNMKEGKFAGFPSEIWDSQELAPRQGTPSWAEKLAEKQPENNSKTGKLPQDVVAIYDEFKKQAPKSPAWDKWCQIAHELTKKGYRDESLKSVAASRFLHTEVEQHHSAWLMDDYPTEETEDLFRKRVRMVLDDCRDASKSPITDPHEIWNLFSFMKMKDKASLDLLREAGGHRHDTVRSSAYGQAESLPQEEARTLAKKAIQSETDDHCLTMAGYLIRDVGTKADLEWFEAAKPRFGTKRLSEVWEEAVKALREAK